MQKSKRAKVICTVIFIGIILSCTAYFGVTALMGMGERAPDSVSDKYGIPLSGFSESFYGNKSLSTLIDKYEYLIFGSVGKGDIIVGGGGFLFDAGKAENGYSYLKDFLGIEQFAGYELEAFASIIRQRQLAYKNKGVDYLLVVIPNSQTVYKELMPSYIGPATGATRLEQLTSYLADSEIDFFFNTTPYLIDAKDYCAFPLYNNTENSLNSIGEWFVYAAVYNKLSELYGATGNFVHFDSLSTYISYTEGKELARRAGLSEVIRNMTVSISSSGSLRYGTGSIYGNMISSSINEEFLNDGEFSHNVLLEFTQDWDRIQLMPYFSDTFRNVTYKSNLQFSSLAVEGLKPDLVVQFIHESELYDVIYDYKLNLTYNAGMNLVITPDVTASPIVLAQSCTADGRIVIAGRTEEDAIITAEGGDIQTVTQKSIGSLFFIEVDIGDLASSVVYISAKVDGKAKSSPQPIRVVNDGEEHSSYVAVGKNSQLYSYDYAQYSLLDDEQLELISKHLAERLTEIRSLSGKDTEYLYVIVPDKLTVYSEDMPPYLAEYAELVEKYRLSAAEVRRNAGMHVIDLTEELKQHKVLGALYYHTGALWNDLGAFVGYHTLAQKIFEKYNRVNVLNLNSFDIEGKDDIGGELLGRMGFDRAVISERYLKLKPNYTSKVSIEYSETSTFDITQAFISYNEDSSLPVAIVTRDAYGTGMLEALAENFSKMVVMAENDHTIPDGLIAEIKPDYIITVRCNGILS